jgi:hypothetical protein
MKIKEIVDTTKDSEEKKILEEFYKQLKEVTTITDEKLRKKGLI